MHKKLLPAVLTSLLLLLPLSAYAAKDNHEALSTTIKPGEDFYTYVNEDWIKHHPIPKNEASINNFSIVQKNVEKQLKKLIVEKAKNIKTDDQDGKNIGTFYKMAKNFKQRDKLGIKPVQGYIDAINKVKNNQDFNTLSENLVGLNYSAPIKITVAADQKNSQMNVLYIAPPSIGLDIQYYLDTDDYSIKRQNAYKDWLANIFTIAGEGKDEATKNATTVFNLEKNIATSMLRPEDKVDSNATYHIMTLAEIEKLAPNLAYSKILKTYNLDKADKIIVMEPKALAKVSELLTAENLPAFKQQAIYQILTSNQDYLGKNIIDARDNYIKAITGVQNKDSNNTLALKETEEVFDNALGKLYVDKYFDPNTKTEVIAMANDIRNAFKNRIKKLYWLSDATKTKAINKIDKIELQIGYPNKWEDYSSIHLKDYKAGGNLVYNKDQVLKYFIDKNFSKINKPTDKEEWAMAPQTVNAYYDMLNNIIVVPAGILQAPIYNPQSKIEEKLGGFGAVLAHELSHSVDSRGAQFDEKGNLNPWWTDQDNKTFDDKVNKVADTFSKIEVSKDYFINGTISSGEIMADLGGLTIVNDIVKNKKLDSKLMFQSYAKIWRDNTLEDVIIANLTDEHPPAKNRVNNIVNNLDDFYTVYNIKANDPMYVPDTERLKIW